MCCTLRTLISGTCTLLVDAASAAAAADGPPAADRPSSQQLALFRVNKLSALCLTTLASHAAEAAATLGSPLTALATSQQPEAALLDFLIKVINPDIWKQQQQQGLAAGEQQGSQAGAAAVLRHLYNRQLYGQLRVLLQAAPAGTPSKSAVEVLVTQMTVRCITLQLVPTRTPPQAAAPAAAAAGVAESSAEAADVSGQAAAGVLAHGVSQLLFVPGLWAKCGSLAPVIGRLCSLSLAELSQQPSSRQLLDALAHSSSRSSGSVTNSSSSKHRSASEAAAAVDAAAHSLSAWMENLLAATAAGAVLKGAEGDQAIAAHAVSVLLLVLQAGRQVAVLQKHVQRQLKQQQRSASPHVGAAAAVGQAGAASTARTAAAFVPGAGFTAGGIQAMEMDEDSSSGAEDEMEADDVTSPKAAAAAGSSSSAGAASASAGAAQQQQGGSSKAAATQAVAASAYSGEKAVAQQVAGSSSCLQLLAGTSPGTQLLRKLCALLLPAATADSAAQLQLQLRQGQTAAAVAPGGAAQQQLCALLWTLSRPKQYRQRIWLGLSVGVRLVPRLWFSYISPLHQATPKRLLSLSSTAQGSSIGAAAGSASSCWVQPLLVLAQSYSAALSFTHLEDFYADAAPLVPLTQLYDAANPSGGLVMLLKAAVWQVRECACLTSAAVCVCCVV
jgi:hypothetical protein